MILICDIMGCKEKGSINLMMNCFERNGSKPFWKKIMRVCESHSKQITANNTLVKIQAHNNVHKFLMF